MPADPAEGVSPAALRHAMAQFAAGVTIVTTRWQGIAHAMTATAFCSVSLEPPLVLVCVSHSSRFHRAVTASGQWAASVLAGNQEPLARHFAHRGRDLLTQFDRVPFRPSPATGSPLILGALTWLDCRTYAMHDGGDHTIVVGEVLQTAEIGPGGESLTYFRSRYGPLS
jgi:flavin reductase